MAERKNKKKNLVWVIEILLLLVILGIYAAIVYGGLGTKLNLVLLVGAIMVACIDLIVIFNF